VWQSKKLILAVLLPDMLLVGSLTGVAVAATDDTGDGSQLGDRWEALLARVCEIYEENTGVAIDPQQLEDAFDQARREMEDKALESWLQNLVDQGKITREQADQYLEWGRGCHIEKGSISG
jgi:hypothetical protein